MSQVRADIVDGKLQLESEYEHQDRIGKLVGAHWDKKLEKWTLPLTWSACLSLYNTFGTDFVASPAVNDWGFHERNNRIGPAMALRDRLDIDGVVPNPGERSTDITVAARDIGKAVGLFPHQQAGAAFIGVTDAKCLILDEQGTGKSKQLIIGARTLQRLGTDMFPMLVVSPSTVKTHWEREFAATYPGLEVVRVGGSAVQRRKQLTTPAHVYVINFDLLPKHSRLTYMPGMEAMKRCEDCGGADPKITETKCQVHERELNRIPFRSVVVDEAQRIISPKAAWTRALWSIGDAAQHRIGMTGTPIQATIEDLWALLRFIEPDEFGGKKKFLDRYAETTFNHFGVLEVQGMKPHMMAEFDQITQPYMRRMLKSVVLPFLPPIMPETRTVDMSGAQAKAYRELVKTMMLELEGKAIPTTDPLVKATRLMQLASSYGEIIDPTAAVPDPNDPSVTAAALDDDKPYVKLQAPSNKISAFMDDVLAGDYDGNKGVVVFAQSKQLLDMLSKELTAKKVDHGMITGGMTDADRDTVIDNFQAEKFKYVLVSLAAGGAGLTLTAADTMVYLQRSWSSTQMEQSKARAHRIGSEKHDSIRQVDYVSDGTIEEHQLEVLAGKKTRIEEVLKDGPAFLAFMRGQAAAEEEPAA